MEELAVLVVEDDQAIQGIVEEALTEAGFEPAIAASGEEAITLLKGIPGACIDIDLLGRMMDGKSQGRPERSIGPSPSST